MTEKYIVICGQIIGGNGQPFETVYGTDGEEFADKNECITHGLSTRGSDDFNIGLLRGGKLAAFYWMDNQFDNSQLVSVAANLGIDIARST